jgi:NAD-dependent dihydropyrimidine dehydrogenase PreA subunit
MAYVITEACTKDALCVDACPVDCIHPKKDEPDYEKLEMLFVDPVECIDCGACVPVCESNAVFPLDEVPPEQAGAIEKNATYFGR